MKKLSKAILSVAAVSAVSAVMAASAMAMTASYADGKVTLSDVTATGDSQTLLVLSGANDAIDTVTETIIKQIDQDDTGVSFSEVTVGALDEGTYTVRVGGSNGTMQVAEFTIGGGSDDGGDDVKTKDIIVGDINLNGEIANNDLTFLARKCAGSTSKTGNAGEEYTVAADSSKLIIGDINLNGEIANNDLTFLARKCAGSTSKTGNAGETIAVVATAE